MKKGVGFSFSEGKKWKFSLPSVYNVGESDEALNSCCVHKILTWPEHAGDSGRQWEKKSALSFQT